MKEIILALQHGISILAFPEGTRSHQTNLLPFKIGAFKVAAEAGVAVCPIALQGTINILQKGSRLLTPDLFVSV